ncbi:MAG TPA: BON domain-containing protein [Blastocatellia bacterium]|nr:BON domain-containing protein [Blastocatellia bacterium]
MLKMKLTIVSLMCAFVLMTIASNTLAAQSKTRKASTLSPVARIASEVRHELLMLPYYDVFDWIEGQVEENGTVVLRGQVVRPTTKSDAEKRIEDIEGVERVENNIEVLPVSPNDNRLRVRLYRAIYNFNSPLFKYSTRAVPPIHIIVKNGRVWLKGVVANEADKNLAYIKARGVPGVFSVTNELVAESSRPR